MYRPFTVALIIGLALLGASGYARATAGAPAAACLAFPETGKQVCGEFLTYWQGHGGLEQQGMPLSDEFDEVNPTDGKTYRTQYFERARFEYHPELAGTEYAVLLGLLGLEQFGPRYPNILPPVQGDPFAGDPGNRDCATFAFTGERVCGPFLSFWKEHGGLEQQGYPISPVFLETNALDGKQYPVQYFERARFEFHAENGDPAKMVLLGLLGSEEFAAKYPGRLPGSTPPSAGPLPGASGTPRPGPSASATPAAP